MTMSNSRMKIKTKTMMLSYQLYNIKHYHRELRVRGKAFQSHSVRSISVIIIFHCWTLVVCLCGVSSRLRTIGKTQTMKWRKSCVFYSSLNRWVFVFVLRPFDEKKKQNKNHQLKKHNIYTHGIDLCHSFHIHRHRHTHNHIH